MSHIRILSQCVSDLLYDDMVARGAQVMAQLTMLTMVAKTLGRGEQIFDTWTVHMLTCSQPVSPIPRIITMMSFPTLCYTLT